MCACVRVRACMRVRVCVCCVWQYTCFLIIIIMLQAKCKWAPCSDLKAFRNVSSGLRKIRKTEEWQPPSPPPPPAVQGLTFLKLRWNSAQKFQITIFLQRFSEEQSLLNFFHFGSWKHSTVLCFWPQKASLKISLIKH